ASLKSGLPTVAGTPPKALTSFSAAACWKLTTTHPTRSPEKEMMLETSYVAPVSFFRCGLPRVVGTLTIVEKTDRTELTNGMINFALTCGTRCGCLTVALIPDVLA